MSLYDILACPNCKTKVEREPERLRCTSCGQTYPIVNGVPVMMPDGSVPDIKHEAELTTRDTYLPWIHRNILLSLNDDQVVLEIGSGTVTLDDPCIIRTDVILTPFVDVVADAHALPFLPESVDYIFSLAVFEHLRNPFQASHSIYETLKDGGYVYHDCNFIIPYHGYPHHYFNATEQGMSQVFAEFTRLRQGVAPYQMPSFALELYIRSFLMNSRLPAYHHGQRLVRRLEAVLEEDLRNYDIYFSEEDALKVAVGTYFSGYKQQTAESSLIPLVLRDLWAADADLQARYPDINDLTGIDNIVLWARREGREQHPQVQAWLDSIVRYNKRGGDTDQNPIWDRTAVHAFFPVSTHFGAMGFDPNATMAEHAQIAEESLEHGNGFSRTLKRVADLARFGGVAALRRELRSFVKFHLGNGATK